MTTKEKIEKMGYKVVFLIGYKNGVQSVTSVSATKGRIIYVAKNITSLLRQI